MKKLLLFLTMTLLMLCLCSCPSSNAEQHNNKVVISFVNQCNNTAVYGLHVEYYIEDKAVGGQLVSLNPNLDTPFQKEQTISIYLIQKDFPKNADLHNFAMEVFIVLENKSEVRVDDRISLPVEFSKNYQFLLIENNGNYSIKPS